MMLIETTRVTRENTKNIQGSEKETTTTMTGTRRRSIRSTRPIDVGMLHYFFHCVEYGTLQCGVVLPWSASKSVVLRAGERIEK